MHLYKRDFQFTVTSLPIDAPRVKSRRCRHRRNNEVETATRILKHFVYVQNFYLQTLCCNFIYQHLKILEDRRSILNQSATSVLVSHATNHLQSAQHNERHTSPLQH